MFVKTALLSGAALLMFGASAPAMAQDAHNAEAHNPETNAAESQAQPAPAAPGTLQIQPGSDVKGSDGALLGKLEGVQTVAGAQQLKVRGTDGVLRGVPLNGLKPDGAGITVAWTTSEFQSAPPIAEPATPVPTGEPSLTEPSMTEPPVSDPMATPPVSAPDEAAPDEEEATPQA